MAREQLGLFDRGYAQGYRDAEKDSAPTGGGKTMARKVKRRRSAVGRKIRAGARARSTGAKKSRKKGRKKSASPKGLAGRVSRLEKNVGGVDCKALAKRVGHVEGYTLRVVNVLRKHAGRPSLKSLSGSPTKGVPSRGKGF